MAIGKRLKRDNESKADAQICLTCPLPFCSGTDKCFRSCKRELNHGRTMSEPREPVEEQSRTGTGGSGGEAVIDLDFTFDLPDFDGLLDDLDLDFSLDEIDLDFSFDLSDDLPLNSERTEKK